MIMIKNGYDKKWFNELVENKDQGADMVGPI